MNENSVFYEQLKLLQRLIKTSEIKKSLSIYIFFHKKPSNTFS